MEYTMLILALSVVAAVLSVVALIYTQILTKRYSEAVTFMESVEKDVMHMQQGSIAFRKNYEDDKKELTAMIAGLESEMETARAAMNEWYEAGKIALKSEKDFNEGLNNIINFQPGVSKKGDDK